MIILKLALRAHTLRMPCTVNIASAVSYNLDIPYSGKILRDPIFAVFADNHVTKIKPMK